MDTHCQRGSRSRSLLWAPSKSWTCWHENSCRTAWGLGGLGLCCTRQYGTSSTCSLSRQVTTSEDLNMYGPTQSAGVPKSHLLDPPMQPCTVTTGAEGKAVLAESSVLSSGGSSGWKVVCVYRGLRSGRFQRAFTAFRPTADSPQSISEARSSPNPLSPEPQKPQAPNLGPWHESLVVASEVAFE